MVTSDTRHFDSVKFRCAINYFEKTKIKKKRPGMAHLKSVFLMLGHVLRH